MGLTRSPQGGRCLQSVNKIILTLVLSCASAIAYRAGGSGHFPRQARIIGVPALSMALLAYLTGQIGLWLALAYFLSFGAMAGAISAYWGLDEKKWGYWAHGLGLSLAMAHYAFVTGHWVGFAIRTIVLTVGITLWSQFTKWDVLEEMGRGFLITASIPLLLL